VSTIDRRTHAWDANQARAWRNVCGGYNVSIVSGYTFIGSLYIFDAHGTLIGGGRSSDNPGDVKENCSWGRSCEGGALFQSDCGSLDAGAEDSGA
jgi:hypothetical protein